MRLIFLKKNTFLQIKLILAIIISIAIIVADGCFGALFTIRVYMNTILVSPFYFLVGISNNLVTSVSSMITNHSKLKTENQMLRQELILKNSEQILLNFYKRENDSLRNLLKSPLRKHEKKMITKVISIISDSYCNQIMIDKGSNDGVYIGQPVINDKGVVGQIIEVSKFMSRVLLICDVSHALPIQILRNNVRLIINGNGCNKDLQLEYLSRDIDIRVGDMLVTSGLDGRFPEGYPVAIVSSVRSDHYGDFNIIQARPTASLHKFNYLLLLWSSNSSLQ